VLPPRSLRLRGLILKRKEATCMHVTSAVVRCDAMMCSSTAPGSRQVLTRMRARFLPSLGTYASTSNCARKESQCDRRKLRRAREGGDGNKRLHSYTSPVGTEVT
jgi:hypothetical protein